MSGEIVGASRRRRVVLGGLMVSGALAACGVSAWINFRYGLSTNGGDDWLAATIYVLADGAKIGLLFALGVGGWNPAMRRRLRGVWALALAASLWAACNSYANHMAASLIADAGQAQQVAAARALADGNLDQLSAVRAQLASITETGDASALERQEAVAERRLNSETTIADGAGVSCSRRADCAAAETKYSTISERLGYARRRDTLQKREMELIALATTPQTMAVAVEISPVHGVAAMAEAWAGIDKRRGERVFGTAGTVLLIALMEALILLAEPGAALLFPASHVHVVSPVVESAPGVAADGPDEPQVMTADDLRGVRDRHGGTQEEFAARCSIPLSTYRKMEQGAVKISLANAQRIRAATAAPLRLVS